MAPRMDSNDLRITASKTLLVTLVQYTILVTYSIADELKNTIGCTLYISKPVIPLFSLTY